MKTLLFVCLTSGLLNLPAMPLGVDEWIYAAQLRLTVDTDGSLHAGFLTMARPPGLIVEPLLLGDETVRNELELSSKQRAAVDLLATKLVTGADEFNRRFHREKDGQLRVALDREAVQWAADISADIRATLLSHQLERLGQLEVRYRLRLHGLYSSLVQGDLRPTIVISAAERTRLRQIASESATRLSEAVLELQEKSVNHLMSPLSSAQREELQKILDGQLVTGQPYPEVLIWQLSEQSRETDDETEKSLQAFAVKGPDLTMNYDGSLRQYVVKNELPEYARLVMQAVDIDRLLTTESTIKIVEFLPVQVEAVEQIYQSATKDSRPLSRQLRELDDDQSSEAGIIKDQLARLWKNAVDDMVGQLLPHQMEVLELWIGIIQYYREGPLLALTNGELGRRLEINKATADKLLETAKVVRGDLIDSCREEEKKAVDLILGALTDENRGKLEKLLGPDTKTAYPTVGFLIDDLQQELPRRH